MLTNNRSKSWIDNTQLHLETVKLKQHRLLDIDWTWCGFRNVSDFEKAHDKKVCSLQINLGAWVFNFWFLRRYWHK